MPWPRKLWIAAVPIEGNTKIMKNDKNRREHIVFIN